MMLKMLLLCVVRLYFRLAAGRQAESGLALQGCRSLGEQKHLLCKFMQLQPRLARDPAEQLEEASVQLWALLAACS